MVILAPLYGESSTPWWGFQLLERVSRALESLPTTPRTPSVPKYLRAMSARTLPVKRVPKKPKIARIVVPWCIAEDSRQIVLGPELCRRTDDWGGQIADPAGRMFKHLSRPPNLLDR